MVQVLSILLLVPTIFAASNGWNDNINWVGSLEEMKEQIDATGKPGMVLIHKSWCGACKNLKPRFASSNEIEQASADFIMFNALDDDEPKDKSFSPDGGYIPRILFIDPNTKEVDASLTNPGRDSYKYFYPDPNGIVAAMGKAKNKFAAGKEEL